MMRRLIVSTDLLWSQTNWTVIDQAVVNACWTGARTDLRLRHPSLLPVTPLPEARGVQLNLCPGSFHARLISATPNVRELTLVLLTFLFNLFLFIIIFRSILLPSDSSIVRDLSTFTDSHTISNQSTSTNLDSIGDVNVSTNNTFSQIAIGAYTDFVKDT